MWDRLRVKLLKLISLFTVFSFTYPALMVARTYIFYTGGTTLDFVAVVLAASIGIGTGVLLCRKEYSLLRLIVTYSAILLPVAVSIAFYSGQATGRIVFEAIAAAVFYVIGVNTYLYRYNISFSYQSSRIGIVLLSLSLLIACLNVRYMFLKSIIFNFAFTFIFLSIIIITQDNIDFVIHKRGVESKEVQKKIRRFNIGIVLALYAVILFLFNFKKIVLFVLNLIKLICGKVMDLIIYILKLLFKEKGGSIYEEGFGFMPFDPQPAWQPIIVLIYYTLIHFIFLLIVYLLLPVIYKGIKSLVTFIKGKLLQLINTKPELNYIDNNECTETIEIVKIIKPKTHKQKTNLYMLLDKTNDLSEKIRLMYRISINLLLDNGVAIQRSDTTGQIYEKSISIAIFRRRFFTLTKMYNEVRYGGLSPLEDEFNKTQDEFNGIVEITKSQHKENNSFKV